ncbi:MAG: DUF1573 domain-containing protein [Prevotellaceae bacterium]|jgi:hypothetical protein|nr:DUF1573 domain-containing protein [Prevotellaceae bacterium]
MNRKLLFIFLTCCIFTARGIAQELPQSGLVFDKTVHDFGDILLSDGKQNCTFTFTNKGNKPIVIQTVIASCGCTDPKWEKAPVMPGKSGTIKVTFSNDQGPYPFDKTIAVYTTESDFPFTLRIKGTVFDKRRSITEMYPISYGNLRLQKRQFFLGQIAQGGKKTDSVQVFNMGKSTIEIGFTNVSKGLIISANPTKLKPGAKGTIFFTVDTRAYIDWGRVTYSALPSVVGTEEGSLPIEITAEVLDNFSLYSREQLNDAPKLYIEDVYQNFGDVKQGTVIQKTFIVTNNGKSPLIIRKASTPNSFTKICFPKEIAAGKSEKIVVTLDTALLTGQTSTIVNVVTNVPQRPLFTLMVAGYVVNQ